MSSKPLPSPVQRTIAELQVRYFLHPELRDIYVEGPKDKNFWEWILKESGATAAAVYPISTIDIETAPLQEMRCETNNRGRVVFLALSFSNIASIQSQITCIVDADLDFFIPKVPACGLLFTTDFTCLEMYLLDVAILKKFFSLSISTTAAETLESQLDQMHRILFELFLIRLANASLQWNMENLDFDTCLSIEADNVWFDADEFVTKYLSKNSRLKDRQVFDGSIAHFRALANNHKSDKRKAIHGHDFLDLLCWYVRKKHHSNENRKSVALLVKNGLWSAITLTQLKTDPLITRILARVT